MIYEDSRDQISYEQSKHHVSFKIVKANGDAGTISHFGGENWFGTGCFEGYSREYLKAFYRDFSADYNELINLENKRRNAEYNTRGWAGLAIMVSVVLAMICIISFGSVYMQDLTFNQAEKKISEIWYLFVLPIVGIILSYWRMTTYKKKIVESEKKFEEVSRECNLKF
ncbi:hypothetical protein Sf19_gp9 [Shigella phage Sf19]|uniref:Uncharacterized protein n=1 Tax=Shigella phage Sf19 TaxID=2024306 RepID=A0A2K9V2D1_9CAUD|nr:hypothetical protein Sf19_gp9 [Shigella phage Sf19]